jgi:hypothetical protein
MVASKVFELHSQKMLTFGGLKRVCKVYSIQKKGEIFQRFPSIMNFIDWIISKILKKIQKYKNTMKKRGKYFMEFIIEHFGILYRKFQGYDIFDLTD